MSIREAFDAVVGDSMGVFFLVKRTRFPRSPTNSALVSALFILALISLPLWFYLKSFTPSVCLSIWGAIYFGWAVFISRSATKMVRSIIISEIEPIMSSKQKKYVASELMKRHAPRRVLLIAVLASLVGTVASGIALIKLDLDLGERIVVSIEFFVFYVTAAQATHVARFYTVLYDAIDKHGNALGVLVPSESPIVIAVRSIGATIAVYWIGITLSILTLFFFLSTLREFVLVVVPMTSIFSFLLGSLTYVSAASKLDRCCRRSAQKIRFKLDREAKELLSCESPLDVDSLQRLHVLASIGDVIEKRRRPGILVMSLGVLASLIGPMVTIGVGWRERAT